MARTLTTEGFTCCKVYIRNCAVCCAPFVGRHARSKYCKPSCKDAANRERLARKYIPSACGLGTHLCQSCGRDYKRVSGRQLFCSSDCERTRTCDVCGASYLKSYAKQRTCGRACGAEYRRRHGWEQPRAKKEPTIWPASRVYIKPCAQCGRLFVGRSSRVKVCDAECARLRNLDGLAKRYASEPGYKDKVLAQSHARRADKLGLASNKILLSYLIERDHGRCGICHKPVRAKQGKMRPSIDHAIPLSRGGTHDLSNVQLAHYWCNLSKGNRGGGEQLLLVG